MSSVTALFPTVYSSITVDHSAPVFKDKTIDIKEWDDNIIFIKIVLSLKTRAG